MLTTAIGAYPKPLFLKLPDWFNAEGGTDTIKPTAEYENAIKKMGGDVESIFLKAAKEVIDDQIECGINIITDGEVRRENNIHYQKQFFLMEFLSSTLHVFWHVLGDNAILKI